MEKSDERTDARVPSQEDDRAQCTETREGEQLDDRDRIRASLLDRLMAPRACLRCKILKIKCEDGSPCRKCRENDAECTVCLRGSRGKRPGRVVPFDDEDEALPPVVLLDEGRPTIVTATATTAAIRGQRPARPT